MEIRKAEPEGDLALSGGPADGQCIHSRGLAWFVNQAQVVDGGVYFRSSVHCAEFREMQDGSDWPPQEKQDGDEE